MDSADGRPGGTEPGGAREVLLFVFDGLADWEIGYLTTGVSDPAFQRCPGRTRIRTFSPDGGLVTTLGGLRIRPEGALGEVSPEGAALLVLPGGRAWEEGRHGEAVELARACLDRGVPVGAICAATLALARAGLLDGRRHTSNAREYLSGAEGYRGASLYEEAPAVEDGDLITAAGTAPLEFTRLLFRRLDLYEPRVLEAWYGLFRTGDKAYWRALAGEGTGG